MKIGDIEITDEMMNDDTIKEFTQQLIIIESKLREIYLEQSRLNVAKTVFSNSFSKYISENKENIKTG